MKASSSLGSCLRRGIKLMHVALVWDRDCFFPWKRIIEVGLVILGKPVPSNEKIMFIES